MRLWTRRFKRRFWPDTENPELEDWTTDWYARPLEMANGPAKPKGLSDLNVRAVRPIMDLAADTFSQKLVTPWDDVALSLSDNGIVLSITRMQSWDFTIRQHSTSHVRNDNSWDQTVVDYCGTHIFLSKSSGNVMVAMRQPIKHSSSSWRTHESAWPAWQWPI